MPDKQKMIEVIQNYCNGRECEECCLRDVVGATGRCGQEPNVQHHYQLIMEEQRRLTMYNDFKLQANLEPPEDDRPIKHLCDSCGEPIREGDDYYYINDEYYCDQCVENGRRYG